MVFGREISRCSENVRQQVAERRHLGNLCCLDPLGRPSRAPNLSLSAAVDFPHRSTQVRRIAGIASFGVTAGELDPWMDAANDYLTDR